MKETKRFTLPGLNITDVTIQKFGSGETNRVFLLLHGYGETGQIIFKRLAPFFERYNALVISPNGPFPLPVKKETHYEINFAWYFFDNFKNEYFIDFSVPSSMLKSLVTELNPNHLPVTIIGYSQGGYLAPFAGNAISETDHVIGINCVFREDMIQKEKMSYHLDAIHGKEDLLVDPIRSKNLFSKLVTRTKGGQHTLVEDHGHRLEGEILKTLNLLLVDRLPS